MLSFLNFVTIGANVVVVVVVVVVVKRASFLSLKFSKKNAVIQNVQRLKLERSTT